MTDPPSNPQHSPGAGGPGGANRGSSSKGSSPGRPKKGEAAAAAEDDPPGAGTLYVQRSYERKTVGRGSRPSSRSRGAGVGAGSGAGGRLRPSSGSRSRERPKGEVREWIEWPPTWHSACARRDEPVHLQSSADSLLERGIAEYTFLPAPDGTLGRGKFSTVYKVTGLDDRHYALKHTPLHNHHPLIAARLLREPTLLAQLVPHPCLIGVDGWVRTEGHFYLIEEYATSHFPLPLHPLPLRPSRAAYILDQLVSVVRDCLHRGRVCHRDLKGDNVLVDVQTGDVVVLDLGLATQFSMSEPKLTTCCGSPAFHSPEIVHALNHPPGAVTYYGPELDIWCIALTLLSLLLCTRFPLGPKHKSRHVMASRVRDRLQELDAAYPPSRPAGRWSLCEADQQAEAREWLRVRRALMDFLEVDGVRRIMAFERYTVGERMQQRLENWEGERRKREDDGFRQVSFVKGEVKYTLPLTLLSSREEGDGVLGRGLRSSPEVSDEDGEGIVGDNVEEKPKVVEKSDDSTVVLLNPTHESKRRVLSYLKYLLRTHGILYHCVTISPETLLQLVVPLAPRTPALEDQPTTRAQDIEQNKSWLPSIFRPKAPRSISVPVRPKKSSQQLNGKRKEDAILSLRCFVKIEFDDRRPSRTVSDRGKARTRSPSGSSVMTAGSNTPSARSLSAHASLGMTKKHVNGTCVSLPTGAIIAQGSLSGTGFTPIVASPEQDKQEEKDIDGQQSRDSSTSPTTDEALGSAGDSLAVVTLQNALLRITTTPATPSHSPSPAMTSPRTPVMGLEDGTLSMSPDGLVSRSGPPKRPINKRATSQPRPSHNPRVAAFHPAWTHDRTTSPSASLPGSRVQSRASSRAPSIAPRGSRPASRVPSQSSASASVKSPIIRSSQLSRESTITLSDTASASRVIVNLSDPRAASPIRRAFDQSHIQPTIAGRDSKRYFTPPTPMRNIDILPSLGVMSPRVDGEEQVEERGRPRSKDDKSLSSRTPPETLGRPREGGAHESVNRVEAVDEGELGGDETPRDNTRDRDVSRGRRLIEGLLGLAVGYQHQHPTSRQERPQVQEGDQRSASVPPMASR